MSYTVRMGIKSVIFDWNGTLLADTATIHLAASRSIETAGGKAPSFRRFRETTTIPVKDFYMANGANEQALISDAKLIADVFNEHYDTHSGACRTRRGTRQVLSDLAERAIGRVIASNHILVSVEAHLSRLGLRDRFHAVLARGDDGSGIINAAGKDERIAVYLEQQKILPNEAIIVGDAPDDIQVGRQLGMKSVAISGGMYATHRLKKENPDFLIHALPELIGIIKSFG
jgi:phosphoglycolate phosphatase-like HAD superfamily hydrolase